MFLFRLFSTVIKSIPSFVITVLSGFYFDVFWPVVSVCSAYVLCFVDVSFMCILITLKSVFYATESLFCRRSIVS